MSIIVFLSVTGAPGVTTSAIGAAMNWPRPTLYIEADTSKNSSILPGFFRAQYPHNQGLSNLSIDHLRGQLTPAGILDAAFHADGRYFVAGFDSAAAGAGTSTLWGALAQTLGSFEGANTDVIIDIGRYGINDARLPLLQAADSVLLALHPTLADVYAARERVPELLTRLSPLGHAERLALWLVEEPGEQYDSEEVSDLLRIPAAARLKNDPAAAAVFSRGSKAPAKFDRSAFRRSLTTGIDAINHNIRLRRDRLGVRPSVTEEVSA